MYQSPYKGFNSSGMTVYQQIDKYQSPYKGFNRGTLSFELLQQGEYQSPYKGFNSCGLRKAA